MFRQVASQKVQDEAGHIVQVADRFTVEYLEPNLRAVVAVDFGVHVNVYRNSLHVYDDLLNSIQLTDEKRRQILGDIVSGISAMGGEAVMC